MRAWWAWIFIQVTLAAGCGGAGESPPLVPPPQPQLIVSPNPIVLRVQESLSVNVVVRASDGAPHKLTLTPRWSLGDRAIANITSNGVLTAAALGQTVLSVEADGLSATVPVTVADVTTVTGNVRYTDRLYGANGYSGTALRSVRYALIEAYSDDQRLLARTASDGQGHYRINVPIGLSFRLRVLAATDETVGLGLSVRNRVGSGEVYAVAKTGLQAPRAGLVADIDIPLDNPADGAFNILDVLTVGALFARSFETRALPALNAYWALGDEGTFYCPGNGGCPPQGGGIYVLQEDAQPIGPMPHGDNDEFDDDVLWHEFAHFLMDVYARDDSPGGDHPFSDHTLDLRLAFSEGWGDFFPVAVKTGLLDAQNNGAEARLSVDDTIGVTWYVDIKNYFGALKFTALLDIAQPGGQFVYSSNEIAVAKVLNEFMRREGMAVMWPVLAVYFTSAESTDLEAFWDGWRGQRSPDFATLRYMQAILSEREIYYRQDGLEPGTDETFPSSAVRTVAVCPAGAQCLAERHTLYRDDNASDSDVIRFSAVVGKVYRVDTKNLSNGADTFLELFDSHRNRLRYNDNDRVYTSLRVNDAIGFASSITLFQPLADGEYYVRVSTTQPRAPGTGRYGTYQLIVQEGT